MKKRSIKKLPNGGEVGKKGMMKARIALDAEFGNPSAKRMVSPNPKTGMTPEGEGTHYMASMGNYAVPLLQDKGGKNLEYNYNPPPSREDMRFESEEDARYFAEHYKEVAPMMRSFKKGDIIKYNTGGTVKDVTSTGLNMVVPGLGSLVTAMDDVTSNPDGSPKKGIMGVSNRINPISNIGRIAEGKDVGRSLFNMTPFGGIGEVTGINNKLFGESDYTKDANALKKLEESKALSERRLGNINTNVNTIQTNDGNMYPHGGKIKLKDGLQRLPSDNTSSYTSTHKLIKPEDRPKEPIREIITQTLLDQINIGKGYNGLQELPKKYNTNTAKSINLVLEAVKTKTPIIGDLIANTLQTGVEIVDSKYAHGGIVTTDQPGAVAELELNEQMQLPNGNVMGVSGPSHEEGGIEVNVPDGTRVFSDRLKLGKKTFASHAKSINNKIAKLDKKPESSAKANTEMLFNKQLDELFNLQEEMKAIKEQKRSFKNGGVIPAHNVTLMKNGGLLHYSGVDDDPSIIQPILGIRSTPGKPQRVPLFKLPNINGGQPFSQSQIDGITGQGAKDLEKSSVLTPQNAAFATTALSNIIQNQQLNKLIKPRTINKVSFTPGDRPDNVNFSNERAAIDSEIAGARRGVQLGSGSYSTQAGNLQKLRNQQLMAKGRSFQTEKNTNTQLENAYKAQQAAAYNQGVQANLGIDQYNLENQYNYDLWKTGNKMKSTGTMNDTMVNLFNNQTDFNNQMKYWDVVKGGYSGNIGKEIDASMKKKIDAFMKKKNGRTVRSFKKK